jgi:hypothetical protein
MLLRLLSGRPLSPGKKSRAHQDVAGSIPQALVEVQVLVPNQAQQVT